MIHSLTCTWCKLNFESENPRRVTCCKAHHLALRRENNRNRYINSSQHKERLLKRSLFEAANKKDDWPSDLLFTDIQVNDYGLRFTLTQNYATGDSNISRFESW